MHGAALLTVVVALQLGGRALGAVCNAWPERLVRCLVLGAPSWFNMLYRLIRPHLSPTTSAKIQVMSWFAISSADMHNLAGIAALTCVSVGILLHGGVQTLNSLLPIDPYRTGRLSASTP